METPDSFDFQLTPSTSTANLVSGVRKPSKVRSVLFLVIILLVVLSVVFIVLYVKALKGDDDSDSSRTGDNNQQAAGTTTPNVTTTKLPCSSATCVISASGILESLDTSVNPCEDFYQYSCGGFLDKNYIRDDQSSVSEVGKVAEVVTYLLKDLLENEQLIANYSKDPNSAVNKAFSLYKSCMNVSEIEAAGTKPILEVIEDYGSCPLINKNWTNSSWVLEKVLARVSVGLGMPVFVSPTVGPSWFNTSDVVIGISSGKTGLHSRVDDKLLRSLTRKKSSAWVYQDYILTAFKLLGADSSVSGNLQREVLDIFLLEGGFSKRTRSVTEEASKVGYRNTVKSMTLSELNSFTSYKFNWTLYSEELLRGTNKSIGADQKLQIILPDDIKSIIDYITSKPKGLLANEVIWNVIRTLATSLPKAFRDEENKVASALTGVTTPPPRWRTCAASTNKVFEYATALLYANTHLSEEARQRAADLFEEIKNQFIEGLDEQTWMDNPTRNVARIKLLAMRQSIGYPVFIKDVAKLNKIYETIHVKPVGMFQNYLNVLKETTLNKINELGKPPDTSRFPRPPVGMNAFYEPQHNRMTVLVGMLHEPLYQSDRLKALNYGGVGMVIGHEITHGFDISGSQFDEKGNVRSWWTNSSFNNFNQRSRCMAEQYNNTYVYGRKVDGVKTLSENIADNGGLKYAFRAYKKWRDTNGDEDKLPALGFNNDQLFFIGFAKTWCAKYREEKIEAVMKRDTHAINPARVRVPVSNFPEFSKAFGCTPPTKTCTVW